MHGDGHGSIHMIGRYHIQYEVMRTLFLIWDTEYRILFVDDVVKEQQLHYASSDIYFFFNYVHVYSSFKARAVSKSDKHALVSTYNYGSMILATCIARFVPSSVNRA